MAQVLAPGMRGLQLLREAIQAAPVAIARGSEPCLLRVRLLLRLREGLELTPQLAGLAARLLQIAGLRSRLRQLRRRRIQTPLRGRELLAQSLAIGSHGPQILRLGAGRRQPRAQIGRLGPGPVELGRRALQPLQLGHRGTKPRPGVFMLVHLRLLRPPGGIQLTPHPFRLRTGLLEIGDARPQRPALLRGLLEPPLQRGVFELQPFGLARRGLLPLVGRLQLRPQLGRLGLRTLELTLVLRPGALLSVHCRLQLPAQLLCQSLRLVQRA
ncbi:MAG: hypothetical protein NFCOHLIN_02785 [Gammaproteobacteria bacterium]|nr:hypothetical protein [Gammaproteobacteria bacterium]